MPELPSDIAETVGRALAEDVGVGDVTAALISASETTRATLLTREDAVFCGRAWFEEVYRRVDADVRIDWQVADGDPVLRNQTLCELEGPARAILTGERTALNFLQTLSGTATLAHRYAAEVKGTGCRILDTRKTIPGLRSAQKYAVACGGAYNHRLGLFDGVLIKENHLLAGGSVAELVEAASRSSPGLKIEVEVESLAELERALAAGADIIMLDNFSVDELRQAVAINQQHSPSSLLEASGGIALDQVRAVAETGVDFISVGALTKDVRAIDLSMRFTI